MITSSLWTMLGWWDVCPCARAVWVSTRLMIPGSHPNGLRLLMSVPTRGGTGLKVPRWLKLARSRSQTRKMTRRRELTGVWRTNRARKRRTRNKTVKRGEQVRQRIKHRKHGPTRKQASTSSSSLSLGLLVPPFPMPSAVSALKTYSRRADRAASASYKASPAARRDTEDNGMT